MKVVGAEPNQLEQLEATIRGAVQETGGRVVPAVLRIENGYVVSIGAEAVADLIKFVRPRLVYMVEIEFSAEEEVLDRLEGEGDEGWLLSLPEIAAIVRKWRRYDDQIGRLAVGFVADGVLHAAMEEIGWVNELAAEVDTVRQSLTAARTTETENERTRMNKRIAAKVAELVADPRFSAARVGHAKRVVLARSLFAGLSEDDLEELVTAAEDAKFISTGKA